MFWHLLYFFEIPNIFFFFYFCLTLWYRHSNGIYLCCVVCCSLRSFFWKLKFFNISYCVTWYFHFYFNMYFIQLNHKTWPFVIFLFPPKVSSHHQRHQRHYHSLEMISFNIQTLICALSCVSDWLERCPCVMLASQTATDLENWKSSV